MLYTRFKSLGTATVSDVLDEAGFHNQTIDPALTHIGQASPFCGPAICVQGCRMVTTKTTPDEKARLPLYNLPQLAHSGHVMVLATGGFRGGAVTGELLAQDLQEAGIAGLVTDGLIRDRDALSRIELPIVATGSIPTNGARRFQITSWNTPVYLPGPEGATVQVAPGDIVLGDGDGVLIVPSVAIHDVLEMAEKLAQKEVKLKQSVVSQSVEVRAEARAERMSHMVWLRTAEMDQ